MNNECHKAGHLTPGTASYGTVNVAQLKVGDMASRI